jgi:hypothetical protein
VQALDLYHTDVYLSFAEMVLNFNISLAQDTIVMCVHSKPDLFDFYLNFSTCRVWISSEDAAAVAEKNFRIVHAPSNYFYLACHCRYVWYMYLHFCRIAAPVNGWATVLLCNFFRLSAYPTVLIIVFTVTAGVTPSRRGKGCLLTL